MIAVIDNGKGAKDIASILKGKSEVINPKDASKSKASAFVLSDGDNKTIEKNVGFLEKTESPILAIGMSALFLGTLFGSEIEKSKPVKNEKIQIKKPCPLTLDFKKSITLSKGAGFKFKKIPENFIVIGSSKSSDYEILQDQGSPIFLTICNPEEGGDGLNLLRNFEKFVIEVWQNYHK